MMPVYVSHGKGVIFLRNPREKSEVAEHRRIVYYSQTTRLCTPVIELWLRTDGMQLMRN